MGPGAVVFVVIVELELTGTGTAEPDSVAFPPSPLGAPLAVALPLGPLPFPLLLLPLPPVRPLALDFATQTAVRMSGVCSTTSRLRIPRKASLRSLLKLEVRLWRVLGKREADEGLTAVTSRRSRQSGRFLKSIVI